MANAAQAACDFALASAPLRAVVELLPFRRARHEQIGEIDRQEAVRLLGGQFHRHVVDLARRGQGRHARCGDADLARVELRRILLEHFFDIPDHGVGIERRAVMEGDAGTQLEGPFLLVGIVDFPFGREPGNDDARLVGGGQVPHRQRVIHGEAGEAVALKALIGLPQRARNIGSGHADAQGGFGARDARQRHCHGHRQDHGRRHGPASSRFFDTHQTQSFSTSMINSYAILCNGCAKGADCPLNCR